MKKILSLLFFVAISAFANAQAPVLMGGLTSATTDDYPQSALRFTFENPSGKTIANCNFQLILPEGVSVKKNATGKKFLYEKGDATEDMGNFSIAYSEKTGKYTFAVYDQDENFNEEAGHTIVYILLAGDELKGTVTVTNIAFGDPDGNDMGEIADFTIDLATAINGISAEQTKSGAIYNLNGQRVSKATKGVYVVDGKKVAVSK